MYKIAKIFKTITNPLDEFDFFVGFMMVLAIIIFVVMQFLGLF